MSKPVKCKAGGVIDYCISRGSVKLNWAELLENVDERKADLVRKIDLMDEGEPKAYLLANSGKISYKKVAHLVSLLLACESWNKKVMRVSGFGNDAFLKGWMEVARMYEKYNLFVVEPARELRQVLIEIPQLKKSMNDSLHQLVGLANKLEAHDAAIAAKKNQLEKLEDSIGLTGESCELEAKALAAFASEAVKNAKGIERLLVERDLKKVAEVYNEKFGTSLQVSVESIPALRVVIEELACFHRVTDRNSDIFRKLDSLLVAVIEILAQDPEAKAHKICSDINRLQKSLADDSTREKFRARETRYREELRAMDERSGELKERKEVLIAEVKEALKQVFPDNEIELIFYD